MPLSAGAHLGPYEIVSPLGAGGMGEVYRAKDARLGREVAVKVLSERLGTDREHLVRFEREAKLLAQLNHPNIAQIHGLEVAGETRALVMELVEGPTLAERLGAGALPLDEALALARQLVDALEEAHEKGIVHRDLKPQNVKVSRDGRLKVLDFGLAKAFETTSAVAMTPDALAHSPTITLAGTREGIILGTAAYMAPEQARGLEVDKRADIWAFGVVLWEMLVGEPLFAEGSVVDTLSAVMRKEIDLARLPATTPPRLRELVARCLERDPRRRLRDIGDARLALEPAALSGELFAAIGPGETESSRPAAADLRPRRIARAAALAAAIALGFVGGSLLRRAAPSEAPTLRYLTFSDHDSQPAISPDGKTIAFVSERDGRSRIWLQRIDTGDESVITDGPDRLPRFLPDGSAILFTRSTSPTDDEIWRVGVIGGEARRILAHASAVDVSPDGRRLVFSRLDFDSKPARGSLRLADIDGTNERELVGAAGFDFRRPLWSPDGREIAAIVNTGMAAVSGKLMVYDAESGGPREIASANYTLPSALAWSGSDILYARPEAFVLRTVSSRLLRVGPNGGEARSLLSLPDPIESLEVAGSGRVVLDVASLRRNLHEVALAPRGGVDAGRWLTRGSSSDSSPVYSPDGNWVYFQSDRSGNYDLWRVSTASGAVRRLTDHPGEDWDSALSRDGARMFWSSNRTGNFEIWTADADGTGARQLTRDGGDAQNPSPTPDGAWVVYSSGDPRHAGIWKIRADGSEATQLAEAPRLFAIPEVSPDGRFVAYSSGGDVRCIRLTDGSPVGAAVPVGPALRMRWMPDGSAVVVLEPKGVGEARLSRLEFDPEAGFASTPSVLIPTIATSDVRVFGISPDGSRIVLAPLEQTNHLLLADGVPGVVDSRQEPR